MREAKDFMKREYEPVNDGYEKENEMAVCINWNSITPEEIDQMHKDQEIRKWSLDYAHRTNCMIEKDMFDTTHPTKDTIILNAAKVIEIYIKTGKIPTLD